MVVRRGYPGEQATDLGGEAMTPEERSVIRAACRWALVSDRVERLWEESEIGLALAVQALRVSRQPEQGPEPIPCMARASHSATMFCVLPKSHKGSEPEEWHESWGYSYHQGVAANGSRRRFRVEHTRNPVP